MNLMEPKDFFAKLCHPPKRKWGAILAWFRRCFPHDELIRMDTFVPPGMNRWRWRWYVCIANDFSPSDPVSKGGDILFEVSRLLEPGDILIRNSGFLRIKTNNPGCALTLSWEGCGNSSQWTYRFDTDPPELRFLGHYPTRKTLRVWRALPEPCRRWVLSRFHDETVAQLLPSPARRFADLTLRANRDCKQRANENG